MARTRVAVRWGRRGSIGAGLLAVAMGVAACGSGPSFTRREGGDGSEVGREERRKVGEGVLLPSGGDATTSTAPSASTGAGGAAVTASPSGPAPTPTTAPEATGLLTVKDPRGPGRAGLSLVLEGPTVRRVRTGPGGRTEVSAPPGRYRISVEEGCVDDVEVTRGARGDIGLALGDVARGELTADVRLRNVPAEGAYFREGEPRGSGRAGWRPGEIHVLEITMRDRCADPAAPQARAGAPLGRMRFAPGEGLDLVPPVPTAVGPGGRVQIRLRCTGIDSDGSLHLFDAEIPEDRTQLFSGDVLDGQSAPFCSTA